MSLQDLPAITIERLADKAASFGDNKLATALRAAVEEAR
jgi:hypothetical protein